MEKLIDMDGDMIFHSGPEIKNNRNLALKACRSSPRAIQWINPRFYDDFYFMIDIISNQKQAIFYSSDNLKNNITFNLTVCQKYPSYLQSCYLQSEQSFIVQLLKLNKFAISYVPSNFFMDEEFLKQIFLIHFEYFDFAHKSLKK